MLQDIRFAWRTLTRSRGFSLVAVLCLALGIGANTAVFSIAYGVLFRELPFPDAEHLVAVSSTNERRGIAAGLLTFGDLGDLELSGAFSGVAARTADLSFTLTADEVPERIQGSGITPNLFGLLGVQPQLGRLFSDDEGAAAGFEQVVLLSDALWQTRFGADPAIVGRPVRVNGRELLVVGVMPPGFRFPESDQLWVPRGTTDATNRTQRSLQVIARLAPDATLADTQVRLAAWANRWASAYPETHRDWQLAVVSFRDSIVDQPAQRLLVLLMAAVAFVLLIACANVANLLLARASDRGREIALRLALGAARSRVVRQLLTESALLAAAGGVLGALLSVWSVKMLVLAIPEELAYWIRFEVDGAVLLYTAALSLATGVLFGLAPALQATRNDVKGALQAAIRATGARAENRFRNSLVVGEIALALVLLVAAALMVQTFLKLSEASPGFTTQNLLSLRIGLSGDQYDPLEAKATFFRTAAERMEAIPGVLSAAATTSIPADDGGGTRPVAAEGSAVAADEALIATEVAATAGLFETLGVGLLAGRDFSVQEQADATTRVAIVGATLAQRLWPNENAVGRRIRVGPNALFNVIGVAPDLQYEEFGEETERQRLQYHVPYAQSGTRAMAFLVRTSGDPAAAAPAVRAALRRVDPTLAMYDVMTMRERRDFTTWPQRLFGKIFAYFGVTAALLAIAGVYGVMVFNVTRRRREIGVRMSLGASSADVLRLVVGGAARLVLVGVVIGSVGAVVLAHALASLLWGVSPTDPLTLTATPILLAAAGLAASYVAALRAARVEPSITLRE